MLGLGLRIQRLLRAPSRCSLRIRSNCSSSSSLHQVPLCEDDECGDFLPWLRQKAGAEISSVLSIGNSVRGRSLFACKPIQAGDCILKVPYSVQLGSDNLHPSINNLLRKDSTDHAKLALVILLHLRLGQSSEWAPYISSLPRVEDMHSTIFWSDEELQMVKISSLYHQTLRHKAQLETYFFSIKHVLDRFPEYVKDVTLLEVLHAIKFVDSRCGMSSNGFSLIPFADLLNHDPHAKTIVQRDDSKQVLKVIAGQNHAPGDEILVAYQKFCNTQLMLKFGFVIPHNEYDQVMVKIIPRQHDHMLALILDFLDRHTKPSLKDVNDSKGFALMKVGSLCRKGSGIPQSLRAYARVLCCTSLQELQELAMEAKQNDVGLAENPLKNRFREVKAHQLLHSTVDHLIEKYNADLETDRQTDTCFIAY